MISEPPSSFRADITTSEPFFQIAERASLAIADWIDERDFGLRERVILHAVRRISTARARKGDPFEAYIPSWDHFFKATRITERNLKCLVPALKRAGVIEEPIQWVFGFVVPAEEHWKVPYRSDGIETIRQLECIERPPVLKSAMRESWLENLLGQSQSSSFMPATAGIHVEHPGRADRLRIAEGPARDVSVPNRAAPESGHVHVPDHAEDFYSMSHGTHAKKVLEKEFEVGALGGKTGAEILDVIRGCGVQEKWLKYWIRRIDENAALVWDLATEAKVNVGIRNKAAWLNRGYMREMGLGNFSATRPQ